MRVLHHESGQREFFFRTKSMYFVPLKIDHSVVCFREVLAIVKWVKKILKTSNIHTFGNWNICSIPWLMLSDTSEIRYLTNNMCKNLHLIHFPVARSPYRCLNLCVFFFFFSFIIYTVQCIERKIVWFCVFYEYAQ